ncbi:unnamed protein product [Fusarium graminearum]|uniref:Chromosome 1, complete genome n=1 Tax=Gibberella zeae (strain ATCC MYA-4620 / CBS 123657 / FGSC 9075 / NRRL 31084 / PH-1) TaxID=229533 RepID=A0A098D0Q1_GIBZE|nr:unnamed protein product [Fusarium graminearum]
MAYRSRIGNEEKLDTLWSNMHELKTSLPMPSIAKISLSISRRRKTNRLQKVQLSRSEVARLADMIRRVASK